MAGKATNAILKSVFYILSENVFSFVKNITDTKLFQRFTWNR